ncbi:GNAT family N-acetyltransferase [Novosphingobium sp. FKTRR1]|uniref:GNAT family N-acetyltransferase n=1 Tax=Novosphingobium sp. FKTRR1 TaxID=2879118 RepID=UPI001CEFBA2E|nr:GNAT family N-acetyltransferase [Novosphingobium sp. FKTRR1]
MFLPQDDVDRVMSVMEQAFPPEFGEAWNRRQVSDSLLLSGTHLGLIAPDGNPRPKEHDETAGFFLSRSVLDEEELLLFAIAPDHRHKGLGHTLLRRFIEEARARGIRRLFLEMRRSNPAGVLYAAHGFEAVGIRPRYYRTPAGERLDAISQELIIA